MFGIMDINTGKCWPSIGLWYRDDLEQYLYRIGISNIVAVPKEYINTRILKLNEDTDFYEVK